ncbi:heme ABC exporter ATP-binding protein CcmA [Consotaella salsifontis]|uniref:heme ABC exporter ATP-binding protein CcmA n=1 Tax=Consotaella salsifontis TaxID=1365950 RepID=UPI000999A25D|nr:heme ABC exporter ATP-binding protein CcmA [Consotaella salsifontis]
MTVTAAGLSAGRGSETVVPPQDFTVSSGEALVVTGKNGIGKSTLLRTIAGLLPAMGGAISVDGALTPEGEPAEHVSEIAHYLGHRHAMKASVTVRGNLAFWQSFLGGVRHTAEEALEAVDLSHVLDLPFGYLSAGQQRRAAMARLLVVERPLWILDEPTSALDVHAQARFAVLMTAHRAKGGLIIAATHHALGLEDARSLHLERDATPAFHGFTEEDLAAEEGWS